ncbi:MAG: four helix bundle protein [Hydrogenophilales bacterium]|nr:four helix bundle protein [Hydrogenophilales bacterium]
MVSGKQEAVSSEKPNSPVSGKRGAASSEKPHTRLEVWRSAMLLVKTVYEVTGNFPRHEQFGLVSQMRRAAVSIPSNIAEGSARTSRKEMAQFLSIAKGSLSELDTQIRIAEMLGYLLAPTELQALLERTSKLLSGLHRKVQNDD